MTFEEHLKTERTNYGKSYCLAGLELLQLEILDNNEYYIHKQFSNIDSRITERLWLTYV